MITVDVIKGREIFPIRLVDVRKKNKRKEYLCQISTDMSFSFPMKWLMLHRVQALRLRMQMFDRRFVANFELWKDKIFQLIDSFVDAIPTVLKERLKVS